MKHEIKIGIDPSINSTGICVNDVTSGEVTYYIVTSKMTKKMKEFKHKSVIIKHYEKIDVKDCNYSQKETHKFTNILNICNNLSQILQPLQQHNVEAYMEGVSYGSVGSAALVDLSFLNSALRMSLVNMGIPFTIVSPTSLKKFACANGQAEKEVMIDAWKRMDKNIAEIKDIKIDDLADSYFLSCYPKEI